ncbi:hypothetical protein Emed_002582 [Eimeria media]
MAMKYVAAYLMNVLGGKEAPSANDVTQTLKAVGADVDPEILKTLLSAVEGKSVHEFTLSSSNSSSSSSSSSSKVIAAGMEKLQKVPTGGAAAAPAAGGGGGAAAAAPAKEEKKEEPEEEEDADMGFSLFD